MGAEFRDLDIVEMCELMCGEPEDDNEADIGADNMAFSDDR